MVTPSPKVYANVEDLLAGWLKTVLGYEHVVHEQPTNLRFVLPLIVVERFGGADGRIGLDIANVDVDVFATSRADAAAQAENIRRSIRMTLPGYVHGGTVIAKTETISAPSHAPWDSTAQVRRFVAAYRIHLHQFGGL